MLLLLILVVLFLFLLFFIPISCRHHAACVVLLCNLFADEVVGDDVINGGCNIQLGIRYQRVSWLKRSFVTPTSRFDSPVSETLFPRRDSLGNLLNVASNPMLVTKAWTYS